MNKLYTILKTLISKVNNTVSIDQQNLSEVQKQQVKSNLAISVADWNENNPESSAYIKGRTHWAETEEVTIYEGTPEFTLFSGELMDNREVFCYDAYDYPLPDLFQSSPGVRPDAVTITVNDVSYNVLICPHYTALEQFKCKIENGYIAITTNYVGYNALNIFVTEELTNIHLKITCDITTYTCLDEKYIPDSIARTNDYLPINTTKTLSQSQVQNARANIKLDTPDWEQTDATKANFIKNRTHGPVDNMLHEGAAKSNPPSAANITSLEIYVYVPENMTTAPTKGQLVYRGTTTDFTFGTEFSHQGVQYIISVGSTRYYNSTSGYYFKVNMNCLSSGTTIYGDVVLNIYGPGLLQLSEAYIPDTIGRLFYVAGDSSSSAAAWKGTNNDITKYFNGLTIAYKTPNAGPGGGSTSLNINNLGAKYIYINNSPPCMTYPAGSVIILTYDSAYDRWVGTDKDTKNTVGALGQSNKKLFLIGAANTGTNPQSYTNPSCYVGSDNCLYSSSKKVSTVEDTEVINNRLPYIIEGTYDYSNGAYTITSYDAEKVLNSYNNGGTIVLHIATAENSSAILEYTLNYISIDSDTGSQTLSFIRIDDSAIVYYLSLYNGEVDEHFSTHVVSEQQLQNILKKQAYVITGNCTVVDSNIECSFDTTPDIEKIRDCLSTGKPCYLYLEDSDDGQYRIFIPVMDYDADDSIRFQHKDYTSIYTIDLCISDPTSINSSSYCKLVTTNSVYTTQDNGNNHGIFDRDSDDYIPTNASVLDTLRNRWANYTITNNADGTYSSSVTFSNLNTIINKGREVVFRFTDCTGRNVVVPQINRGVSNLIDGKLYYYFSLVYPGLTEDTWNNTYRVFISVNSDNELVVKHDVISNATVSAINTISEKLEA